MNIALSTIVLFVLLIPGLLFRRFYFTEEFSKEYIKQSFFEIFFSAFIPSLILHGMWFFIVPAFGMEVDLGIIASLLSGSIEQSDLESLQINKNHIIAYIFSLAIFASLAGFFSKLIIRYNKLDRKIKLFRFQNSWHYILTGELFDFPRAFVELKESDVADIGIRYIDALVDTDHGLILYEGLFVDYELSGEGGLDFITLKNTKRKFLNYQDKENRIDGYDINGHILVIPFHQIKNINLSYYRVDNKEGAEASIEMVY